MRIWVDHKFMNTHISIESTIIIYVYTYIHIYISQQKHPTGYPNLIFISSSVVHHAVVPCCTSQAVRVHHIWLRSLPWSLFNPSFRTTLMSDLWDGTGWPWENGTGCWAIWPGLWPSSREPWAVPFVRTPSGVWFNIFNIHDDILMIYLWYTYDLNFIHKTSFFCV